MKVELSTVITLSLAIIAGVIGIMTYVNNRKNNQKQETSEDVKDKITMNTKLDLLLTNNTEIKSDIKEQAKAFGLFKDDVNSRLVKMEEHNKQIDEKIESLEKKINK